MNLLSTVQKTTQAMLNLRGVRSLHGTFAGHRVHHYCLEGEGSGPPVLLVHGLGGAANGFAPIFFGLAKRFRRVHAVDMPGHGLSAESEVPLTLRAEVDLLQDFWRERVREPALVVGNSLGGTMAIQLATESPEAVRGLGLLSPGGARVSDERLQELWTTLSVQTAEDARRVASRLFHRTPLGLRILGGQMQFFYGTPSVRALIQDAQALGALEPEVLAGLRAPVLLLWGQSERLLPYEGIEYFRTHLPSDAEVEVLPECGHVPQMECPQVVISRLTRFADARGF